MNGKINRLRVNFLLKEPQRAVVSISKITKDKYGRADPIFLFWKCFELQGFTPAVGVCPYAVI